MKIANILGTYSALKLIFFTVEDDVTEEFMSLNSNRSNLNLNQNSLGTRLK